MMDHSTPANLPRRPNPARAIQGVASTIQPPAGSSNRVLLDGEGPALSVQTTGPRKITVGKESTYELILRNTGNAAAEDVVVLVDIPEWADLLGADASAGSTQAASPGDDSCPLAWRVGRVEAAAQQQLVLQIVPRQGRPFDLAVRWSHKPVASQIMIEVQEPKLAVDLEGPREVHYGKSEVYTLKIANTGTGEAENVVVNLTPMGSGENQAISHNVGSLTPGEKKSIEVELTAREVGNLVIQVDVRGAGGLCAKLNEQVLVRRAALQVDVTGPKVQFVGTVANYHVRVCNRGTATARDLNISASLPSGAKYLSGIESAEPDTGKIQWTLDRLEPNSEKSYVVKCSLGLPGVNRLDVVSTAEGDISATAGLTTQVEAMADLVLEVEDPAGPVAVGEETTYELHIRNRGSKTAPNVEVIAYFSEGIEPVSAKGNGHKIGPGQVVFQPIPSVSPGSNVVLQVEARAQLPGNHVFRAEVHCRPLGTRLVSEETTHFYQDGPVSQQASFTPRKAAPISALRPLRPVDGEQPLVSPYAPEDAAPAVMPDEPKSAKRLR